MQLRKKIFIGLILIISSFIVGKIAIPILVLDVTLAMAVYLFSWLMLFAGIFLCGREGLYYARVYLKHFRKSLQKNTKKGFQAIKSIRVKRTIKP